MDINKTNYRIYIVWVIPSEGQRMGSLFYYEKIIEVKHLSNVPIIKQKTTELGNIRAIK